MELKHKTLALAVAGVLACCSAQGQISGDVVKIGFITDMSGVYSDIDGKGGADAIEMAIADFGGTVNGKKIVLLKADH
ncbi:MAG: ABC transporter substrate-binding protein, partial [Burkholderiaceae bacterium]|nr:ABC transporter substrate-binding protein [Burkholderiaceae bacterium]